MQIECVHCNHYISYDDSAPKFCSECGGSLNQSISSIVDDETIARTPAELQTAKQDLTSPITQEHIEEFNLKTVGPYRLVRKLGQGGMGTVYEAVHIETGRSVALKLLSPTVRGTDEMVQRFRRESQIAASINHPRSTFVYEAGEHEDQLYITMELMGGGTLKDVVAEEGPLPVGRAVDYVLDMIDGLMVAHNAGIVHRDLKPSNSFVDADGRIKVGDFGLAKSFLGDSNLTQTGTFMGTPQFAAPEQIRNSDVDERTDIYAIGGTLFYLLAGRAPFVGNPAQVISSIASDVPPKVSEFAKDVPKPLVRLIGQTLEKDPEKRPVNLNMLRDGLLPFSTRGAMPADPGRRFAAYFIDLFLNSFFGGLFIAVISPLAMFAMGLLKLDPNPQIVGIAILIPLVILYFAFCESYWGRTFGKWIFGMRLVNEQAQTPSFLASLTRAILIPGVSILISQFASWLIVDPNNFGDMNDVVAMTFKTQAAGLLGWVPMVLMIATGRRENGYQCVHGYLTGTRVVRLSGDLESTLLERVPVTVPAKLFDNKKIGEYEIVGQFRKDENGQTVFLARDRELERPVWLFDGFATEPLSEKRRQLTRASRLRVIKQSKENNHSWYATESLPGLPLVEVLADRGCDWRSFCPLLRDVCRELALSEENDLMPENLSVDHLWLDHTGRVRVLDHILVPATSNGIHLNESPLSNESNSLTVDIVQHLLRTFMNHHDHPVEALDISSELDDRHSQEDVLDWMVNRLNEATERPTTWNWVDRIGMLAISMGLEFSLITAVIFITGFLITLTGQGTVIQTVASLVIGLALVAAYGYFFKGGPAMQLSGVELRDSKRKLPVSRIRSIARSMIAWSPWIALMSMVMFVLFYQLNNDPETLQLNSDNSEIAGPVMLVSLIPLSLGFVGVLFAVFNPSRGIPDFLTRTRLMRR